MPNLRFKVLVSPLERPYQPVQKAYKNQQSEHSNNADVQRSERCAHALSGARTVAVSVECARRARLRSSRRRARVLCARASVVVMLLIVILSRHCLSLLLVLLEVFMYCLMHLLFIIWSFEHYKGCSLSYKTLGASLVCSGRVRFLCWTLLAARWKWYSLYSIYTIYSFSHNLSSSTLVF